MLIFSGKSNGCKNPSVTNVPVSKEYLTNRKKIVLYIYNQHELFDQIHYLFQGASYARKPRKSAVGLRGTQQAYAATELEHC